MPSIDSFGQDAMPHQVNPQPSDPELLAAAHQVWTQIHEQPAIYLHGGWQGDRNGNTVANIRWDPALDAAWLTWEEDGLTCFLQADGLGLGMAEMRRIAESLRKP